MLQLIYNNGNNGGIFVEKLFISATKEKCSFKTHIVAPYFRKAFDLNFIPEKYKNEIKVY